VERVAGAKESMGYDWAVLENGEVLERGWCLKRSEAELDARCAARRIAKKARRGIVLS
jgi:hypothetical protein